MAFTTTAQITRRWDDVHEEDIEEWEQALEKYDLMCKNEEEQKGPKIRWERDVKPKISPEQLQESKEIIKWKNFHRSMQGHNKTLIKIYLNNIEY